MSALQKNLSSAPPPGKEKGIFDLSDWGVVSITGPDASDYLNRMSTVAIKKMDASRVEHGAFLTGRGLVVGLGYLQKTSDGYHFIVSPGQAAKVAEHLEQFHFAENLTVADVSSRWAIFAVLHGDFPESTVPLRVHSESGYEYWLDDSRSGLFWVKMKREGSEEFLRKFPRLERAKFERMRIEAAVPQVGAEVSDHDIILEANFDRAVARNKGCYPGQEVVERIFTYGSVNRKLMPVTFSFDQVPLLPIDLTAEGKPAGRLMSIAPGDGERVGLAYIQKAFWDRREPFMAAGGTVTIRIP